MAVTTLQGKGGSRIEIKQSVFIGRALPVRTREEAEDFVRESRQMYPDARHTCYAWVIDNGEHMQKYSDDGEPSGTGGMPILSVLTKRGITNAAVTVTRYFGGILLGKGGLVRAYTDAAQEAVLDAGPVYVKKGEEYLIEAGYDISEKIIRTIEMNGWKTGDTVYSDKVSIRTVCEAADSQRLIDSIRDITSGKIIPVLIGQCDLFEPLPDEK